MVLTSSQSTLAFLGGCIPLRSLFVYLAYKLSSKNANTTIRTASAISLLLIGISFLILHAKNLRLSAPEAGGITWWNSIRPIHGMLYILAGLMLLCPAVRHLAWMVLLGDVILGLGAWVRHRV
jgi:hypothetical protein